MPQDGQLDQNGWGGLKGMYDRVQKARASDFADLYGNYCGGDYTSGTKGGVDRGDNDPRTAEPIDPMDEACRAHDREYGRAEQQKDPKAALEIECRADAELIKAVEAISPDELKGRNPPAWTGEVEIQTPSQYLDAMVRLANTTLTADAAGYRVEESAVTNLAGERVLTQTGYGPDGGVAFRVVSVTNPAGTASLRYYDDNGDGVTDRVQRIDKVTNGDGSKTETVITHNSHDLATRRFEYAHGQEQSDDQSRERNKCRFGPAAKDPIVDLEHVERSCQHQNVHHDAEENHGENKTGRLASCRS